VTNTETFQCREKDCEETVKYEPVLAEGAMLQARHGVSSRQLAIYLACPQGHVNRYELTISVRD